MSLALTSSYLGTSIEKPVHAHGLDSKYYDASPVQAALGLRPRLRLSASTFGAWEDCNRKWAFAFIEGFQEATGATDLGTRVHKILEDYLTYGTEPDLLETLITVDKRRTNPDGSPVIVKHWPGQIASAGLGHLPAPRTALCEVPFRIPLKSVEYEGQVDFIYKDAKRHLPVIGDHKTSIDKKWTKTPDKLAVDPQGVLYPHVLASSLGNPMQDILDRWVYYSTKVGKPDSWVSEYLSTGAARAPLLDAMDRAGVEMTRAYEAGSPALTFKANPASCDKFGGCPHRNGRCQLTLTELLGNSPRLGGGNENMSADMLPGESFMDFLNRKKGEGVATLPGTPPALPARPAYWQPGDPMNEVQEYLASKQKPDYMIAGSADFPPPAEVLNAMMAKVNPALAPVPGTNPGVVNPPEAPPFAPASPAAMPPVTPVAGLPTLPAFALPGMPPTIPAIPTATPKEDGEEIDTIQDQFTGVKRDTLKEWAVQAGLVPEASKMREGGLRNLLRGAMQRGLMGAPAVNPLVTPPVQVAPTVPPKLEVKAADFSSLSEIPTKRIGVYIGCLQVGLEDTVTLADLLVPILAKLKESTKLPHWNLEDYGKGGARLAASLEAWLNDNPQFTGSVYVDARTPEAAHCLPVLLRFAETVCRATL